MVVLDLGHLKFHNTETGTPNTESTDNNEGIVLVIVGYDCLPIITTEILFLDYLFFCYTLIYM